MEGRLKQYREKKDGEATILFYDRGMPDVTAYMDFMNIHYPKDFADTCRENRYDEIFVLPPWEDIYQQDNERYESYQQAEKLFEFLKNGYINYDYRINEVPVGTIKERARFILNRIKELSH